VKRDKCIPAGSAGSSVDTLCKSELLTIVKSQGPR